MDETSDDAPQDGLADPARRALTVSYGAFSCTLEGFDDPLPLVRELTAWFEDVAQRDRLFGADGYTLRALQDAGVDLGVQEVEARTTRLRIANGADAAHGDGLVRRLARMREGGTLRDEGREERPTLADPENEDSLIARFGAALAEDGNPEDTEDAPRDDGEATSADMPAEDGTAADGTAIEDGLAHALSAALGHDADDSTAHEHPPGPAPSPVHAPAVETRRVRRVRRVCLDRRVSAANGADEPETDREHAIASALDGDSGSTDDGGIGALTAIVSAKDDDEADLKTLGWDEMDADDDPPDPHVGGDADADRLFDAVDSRMADDEARRRHNGHAAMRAAAWHGAGRGDCTPSEEPFRADLSDTIRPRRVTRDDADTAERSGDASPLRLGASERVAEGSVARPPEATARAVRPRRVRRAIESDDDTARLLAAVGASSQATDEDAFRTFAEENRAEAMADVIEAAAAFTMLETGDDVVSRQQMLALAGECRPDAPREDGLRAFGRLLRNGHLRKTDGGFFALTDASRFYAIARREVI